MDFTLILVLVVLVTGVIMALDLAVLKRRRGDAPPGFFVEQSRSFFPVLTAVLVLRSFLFEPFQIPSGSMLPTLKIGDFILVNKFEYGLRLPVLGTRVVDLGAPARGDVMVFKYPEDTRINFIKRVVGLPGDLVEYRNKTLFINGIEQLQTTVEVTDGLTLPPLSAEVTEALGDQPYHLWKRLTPGRNYGPFVVPEGQYFVMGDNRDNSNDSRVWGFVDDSFIVGRAVAVWMYCETFLSIPSFADVRVIR